MKRRISDHRSLLGDLIFVLRKLRSAKLGGMSDQFEGSCLCGAVRFVATSQPESVVWCHCESCRKHSGAPVSVFVAFKRDETLHRPGFGVGVQFESPRPADAFSLRR
ncbi:MAG: hypothetical protein WCB44_17235 [Stellaceae bacterium]